MLAQYKTLKQPGSSEIVIKKSRFIGHAAPVESEEAAIEYVERIRKEHWNATHNCFAYMIGERDEIQKQSDDGEPSGTAGKPILEVIRNRGLKNVVVVVTRYFGGIMLGAGGLIRAYADGTVAGIDAAEPIVQVLHQDVDLSIDYTWLGKVENELRGRGTLLGETQFTDMVTLKCMPIACEAQAFAAWLTDLTHGQGVVTLGEEHYIAHPDR